MPHRREGSEVWQIRVGGKRLSSDTTDYAAATALEKKLNSEVWTAEKFGTRATKSWEDLKGRWTKEKGGKKSFRDDERIMTWWDDEKRLGKVTDITKITREGIDEMIQRDRPGIQPNAAPEEAPSENNTANHYVAILAAMLNAACREWGWTASSPKLRLYPKPLGRDMVLTPKQWLGLRDDLPDHIRRSAQFALGTGLREGKVYGARWPMLDMKLRRYTFGGTANKLGNTIPLNETAMDVLRSIKASPLVMLDHVFTYQRCILEGDRKRFVTEPLGCHGKAWWKALHRQGLGDWQANTVTGEVEWVGFTFHGLRHTFATWLGEAGVPAQVIDRLGGWKARQSSTRERYTHLNVESLRPYAAVIDRIIEAGEVKPLVAMAQ